MPYGSRYSGNLQCSDDNDADKKGPTGSGYPDGVIQDYYANQLEALHTHLSSLLTAIEKEGKQPGQSGPPKIVVTNYPNPLPKNLPVMNGSSWATDLLSATTSLYNVEVDYFSGLVDQLNTDLAGWVSDVPEDECVRGKRELREFVQLGSGISVVRRQIWELPTGNTHDLQYREPYAYGFSVNGTSTSLARYPAPAIFHPTITGQQQIATCVKSSIAALFGRGSPSVQSRTVRLLALGHYRVPSTVNGNRVLDSC